MVRALRLAVCWQMSQTTKIKTANTQNQTTWFLASWLRCWRPLPRSQEGSLPERVHGRRLGRLCRTRAPAWLDGGSLARGLALRLRACRHHHWRRPRRGSGRSRRSRAGRRGCRSARASRASRRWSFLHMDLDVWAAGGLLVAAGRRRH